MVLRTCSSRLRAGRCRRQSRIILHFHLDSTLSPQASLMHSQEHWLDQYASGYHAWQIAEDSDGRLSFYRPLGLVERGFDLDGYGYEGRADINATLELDVATTCSPEQLQKRILLAWTALRLHHVLLLSRAVFRQRFMRPAHDVPTRYFLIQFPESVQEAILQARKCLTFLETSKDNFQLADFFHHAQNVARIVQPDEAMSKVFVAPFGASQTRGRRRVQFLLVMGVSFLHLFLLHDFWLTLCMLSTKYPTVSPIIHGSAISCACSTPLSNFLKSRYK